MKQQSRYIAAFAFVALCLLSWKSISIIGFKWRPETLLPSGIQQNSSFSTPLKDSYPGTGIPNRSARIAMLIVYTNYSDYQHATHTLLCYAKSKGYTAIHTMPYNDPVVREHCNGVDNIYFLKLCAAYAYLLRYDFIFFLDGDNAVLNPRHRLEEYIHPQADLIFYERLFSGEIASGSFFIKNSPAGRNFMQREIIILQYSICKQ